MLESEQKENVMADPIGGIRAQAQQVIQDFESKKKVTKDDLKQLHQTIQKTLENIETVRGLKKGTITKSGDVTTVLAAAKKVLTNKEDLDIIGAFQTLLHKIPEKPFTNHIEEEKYKVKGVNEKQGLDKGR